MLLSKARRVSFPKDTGTVCEPSQRVKQSLYKFADMPVRKVKRGRWSFQNKITLLPIKNISVIYAKFNPA